MMITLREIVSGLYGAFRLACLKRDGVHYFNTSLQGFWRSFFAALLVLPLYVILIALRFGEPGLTHDTFRYVSVELISYAVSWVAFPLAIQPFARQFEREENYLGFIVAYNWAAVLQSVFYLPIAMLIVTQLIPAPYDSIISLLAISLIMVYVWFIARVALDVPAGVAIAVVGFDIILSIVIRALSESMMRSGSVMLNV
jgi:hypothetical protein